MKVDLTKFSEAGFDTIWQLSKPPGEKTLWVVGFFCQGVESSLNDGLICYVPCHGEPEQVRQLYLSPACDSIQEAMDKAFLLFEKNRTEEFFPRIRKLKEI